MRRAHHDDIASMQAIEVAAAQRFRDIDDPRIARVADAPPYPRDALEEIIAGQRAWVAVAGDGEVIGFAIGCVVGSEGHLDEVTVAPAYGRRGVGRALIDAVVGWARQAQFPSITLTTFRDVPWNAPYYEKLGFGIVRVLSPELHSVIEEQATWGLDPSLRVVMRRPLTADPRAT